MNNRSSTLLRVFAWVGAATIVAAVVLVIFTIRLGQQHSTSKVDYTQQAAKRILDCTDTNGECATKNRAEQARLIKQLIDANATNAAKAAAGSAYCTSHGVSGYENILACTLNQMNKDKR